MCYYYDMEEKDIVAYNIAYYRKKIGLSQLELAQKLSYSNKNISKWEKGETTPNVFVLKKIADLFGIKVDTLLTPLNDQEIEIIKPKKDFKTLLKKYYYMFLTMSIIAVCVCVAICTLAIINVTAFNKWLLLLYMIPAECFVVMLFIRIINKKLDIISLSLFGWLTAVSVHLSLLEVKNIAFVYIIAAAYQILCISIVLIINFRLVDKFKKKLLNLHFNKKAKK